MNLANKHIAVIGHGVTGQSCVRFLLKQEAKVTVFDRHYTAASNAQFTLLQDDTDFSDFDILVLSPGISPQFGTLPQYVQNGGQLIGDIELFAWFNRVPVIGVTGSNGKTTVTDMLGKMLNQTGKKVLLGGNYGTCALDLLGQAADIIVLELSSFQLELTRSLALEYAVCLNISQDHMDRHGTFAAYKHAKHQIFKHATHIIQCIDDPNSIPATQDMARRVVATVSLGAAANANVTHAAPIALHIDHQHNTIANTQQQLMHLNSTQLKGAHNYLNMQVCLAIALHMGLDMTQAIKALQEYQGMAHRFETVHSNKHITWINDSKATNVGACLAALNCFNSDQQGLILIAGGDAKGADLSELTDSLQRCVNSLIVMGKDAAKFCEIFPSAITVSSMAEAVIQAKRCADDLLNNKTPLQNMPQNTQQEHVTVLLSPACASIDMFDNYQARGEAFVAAIKQLAAA